MKGLEYCSDLTGQSVVQDEWEYVARAQAQARRVEWVLLLCHTKFPSDYAVCVFSRSFEKTAAECVLSRSFEKTAAVCVFSRSFEKTAAVCAFSRSFENSRNSRLPDRATTVAVSAVNVRGGINLLMP